MKENSNTIRAPVLLSCRSLSRRKGEGKARGRRGEGPGGGGGGGGRGAAGSGRIVEGADGREPAIDQTTGNLVDRLDPTRRPARGRSLWKTESSTQEAPPQA